MKIYALDSSIAGLDVSMQDIGVWYNQARMLGVPEEVIAKGVSAVRNWANANNIIIPMVPNQQNRIDQEYKQKLTTEKINKEEYQKGLNKTKGSYDEKLIRMGVPIEVIARGKSSIQQYATNNNISLPQGENIGGLNFLA